MDLGRLCYKKYNIFFTKLLSHSVHFKDARNVEKTIEIKFLFWLFLFLCI